ncbi:MAG: hypothetical protein HY686_07670 [Chloroflexi bacterium]|nr:hypothetical protein [Chloroflexota bacterium]
MYTKPLAEALGGDAGSLTLESACRYLSHILFVGERSQALDKVIEKILGQRPVLLS